MRIAARIDLPDDAVGPDPWDEAYGVSLPLNHVICRDQDGTPHYVGDYVWPWTAYHPRKLRSFLHFHYWKNVNNRAPVKPTDIFPEREARIREIQFLMVLVIYFNRNGMEAGFGSLYGKLRCLHLVARFAELKGHSVRAILEQKILFDEFVGTLSGIYAVTWLTWLTFLSTLDPLRQTGLVLVESKRWQTLRNLAERYREGIRQHAPLPTRIYAGLIRNLVAEITDIETHADQLLQAIQMARELYLVAKKTQPYNTADFGPKLIQQNGLTQFLIRRGLSISLYGLLAAVNELFLVCKILIHVFSGMRSEEARTLPFHCMVTERGEHGRTHCLIAGITTKLEGARRLSTKWVTTDQEGFRAIRLAQRFAGAIYAALGKYPSAELHLRDATPLFPSTAYMPWLMKRHQLLVDQATPASLNISRARQALIARLVPTIEEADICELEEIDPFRSWREESDFVHGGIWPLTTHQLRRSLALYANASGFVRLSSLRRQLQHLTSELSLYYARGSTFCKNFLESDQKNYQKHIAPEWQDGNDEAQLLAFTLDVLNSKERLFGGAGSYFQRRRDRGEVMTRAEVTNMFKAGLLSYSAGPLGGCTKPGICKIRKGLNLVEVACATDHCKHLIGKHSKIIQVIRLKRQSMSHTDLHSIEYAMEEEEIKALEKVEITWRSCSNDVANGPED